MPDWMWFVIALVSIVCVTLVVISAISHRDLNNFNLDLPKLPSLPGLRHMPPNNPVAGCTCGCVEWAESLKHRDDQIMRTVQEGFHDDQSHVEGR